VETVLSIVAIVLLFGACLIGLLSLIFGLPGTFVIFGAVLVYAWATGFTTIQWTVPAWLLAMAIAGEVIELFAGSAAVSARSEPNRRVTIATFVGALLGGIVGTPFLFGIGSLIGAMAGAFIGAALAVSSSGGHWRDSLRIGFAALRGRLLGFVIKSAIAVSMILIVFVAIIP
jgi:hypothetical protein